MKCVRTLLQLVLVLASAALAPPLEASPVTLGREERYSLNDRMELLEDPSGKMGLMEAEAAYGRGEFRPLKKELSAGFTHSAFWLRFELQRTEAFPETGWLRLWPVYTEHMALYLPAASREPRLVGSADMPDGNAMWLPEPAVPIGMAGKGPVVCYLRMQGGNSIALDASIHTYRDLLQYSEVYLWRIAGYVGVSLVVLLIALVARHATGAGYFRLFAVYVFMLLLIVVPLNGLNNIFLPDWTRPLMAVLLRTLTAAGMLAFVRFSASLFAQTGPNWTLSYFRALSLLAAAAMLFSPTTLHGTALSIAMIATSTMAPVLAYLSLKIDMPSRNARALFVAAILATISGHVVFFVHLMGLMGSFAFVHDTVQASSMVHILLLLPALALRIRSTQLEATRQSKRALERAEAIAERTGLELREHSERLELSIAATQSAAERMGQFLLIVAHDYRSPLNVIRGNLDILKRQKSACAGESREELEKIRRATGRLEELVEVSFAEGRVAGPRGTGNEATVALRDFVRNKVAAVRLLWPEREFLVGEAEGKECVRGDISLLDTALFNLLENAHKYAPEGTAVSVACSVSGTEGAIRIQNRAPFLPDEELDTLFEQFRRGPNAAGTTGAGLGLSIVRSIAERQGGRAEIRKTPEGSLTATLFLSVLAAGSEGASYALPVTDKNNP